MRMRALLFCLLLCPTFSYANEPIPQIIISTSLTISGPINFAENSDAINQTTALALTLLATSMKEQTFSLEIAGHADPTREKRSAKKLAARRADAARTYLISQGVDPKRLLFRGYADRQPLNAGASSTESNANRRVEARLIEAK
jgi:outer membrane protein OmpA-like peptidoglycan-associated protein